MTDQKMALLIHKSDEDNRNGFARVEYAYLMETQRMMEQVLQEPAGARLLPDLARLCGSYHSIETAEEEMLRVILSRYNAMIDIPALLPCLALVRSVYASSSSRLGSVVERFEKCDDSYNMAPVPEGTRVLASAHYWPVQNSNHDYVPFRFFIASGFAKTGNCPISDVIRTCSRVHALVWIVVSRWQFSEQENGPLHEWCDAWFKRAQSVHSTVVVDVSLSHLPGIHVDAIQMDAMHSCVWTYVNAVERKQLIVRIHYSI